MKRVLVPVDFSACSQHALQYALAFAQRFGAAVEVLHVYKPPDVYVPRIRFAAPIGPRRTAHEFARSEAQRELEELLGPPGREECVQPVPLLACGDATEEILSRANSGRYSLIIMGTHGRTGLAHFLLGSVAEKVIRRSPCPILTARPPVAAERAKTAPLRTEAGQV